MLGELSTYPCLPARRSLSWQVLFSSISFPTKEPAEFYQSFTRDGKPTQHLVQQIISTVERHSVLPGCWEPLFLLPPPLRILIDFLIGFCCHHAAQLHSLLCVHSRQKSIFLSYIEKKNWFSFFSLCPKDYLFTTNMPIKMFCYARKKSRWFSRLSGILLPAIKITFPYYTWIYNLSIVVHQIDRPKLIYT